MLRYANPANFLWLADRVVPWLGWLTAALAAVGLYGAFFVAPADYQQGETVRIMFIHVPAAWLASFIYGVMTLSALGTLVWRHPLADAAQKAAAPLGAVFTFVCLVTGSLWGKPMWGTWWVWDARLTSVLVLFLIYLGLVALWQTIEEPSRAARGGDPDAGGRRQPADHQVFGGLVEHAASTRVGLSLGRPDHRQVDVVAAAGHGDRRDAVVPDPAHDGGAQRNPAPPPAPPVDYRGRRRSGRPCLRGQRRSGGMNDHTGFIVAAYAITALAVFGMVAAIALDRRALKKALVRFPARDAGDDAK